MTRRGWLAAVRRYLLAAAVGHLAWEIAQLPLFALWHSASSGQFVLSVGYTAYSEYLKTVVRQSWAYSPAVPTLLGVGLSPLAQWIIVPVAALARVHRSP